MKRKNLGYVDYQLARRVLPKVEALVAKTQEQIEQDPEKLRQTREYSLATKLVMVAAYRYVLGHPLESISEPLKAAAEHNLRVFELRGTDPPIPSNGAVALDDSDLSLTNARQGLEAMNLATLTGQLLLARSIAALVGDPLNASYISETSEVCTPDDQRLAYGVKFFLLGNAEAAAEEVCKGGGGRGSEAGLLRSLISRDGEAFLRFLRVGLEEHAVQAGRPSNRRDPSYFIALYYAGLASLACTENVLRAEDLEIVESPHFPLDLVRAGVRS